MTQHKTVLAIDLGGESGRVMAVHFDGSNLQLEELHRFANTTVNIRGTMHWDFLRLWRDVQEGITKGKSLHPASMGVDTWGVDFGLLDAHGELLGNPVHYRDPRTNGMMERVFARVPRAQVFAQTGNQFLQINTLYQLMSLVQRDAPQLAHAKTFLTAPDLLNYWLTGEKVCEFTNATTTQLFNPRTNMWAFELMDALGIPKAIFPPVVQPGTRLGFFDGVPVIAPACHDTGSAVAGVPMQHKNAAYISSGTWSLVGLETDAPILNEQALAANAANEGGVYGSNRLLKNVMGLWLMQQCRATWNAQGCNYSYAELMHMAQGARSTSHINVNDSRFLPPGDHPTFVQAWCHENGQPIPQNHAEIVRCVYDSLANEYANVIHDLQALAHKKIEVVHVVGGGSQNALLCQLTANATGLPVLAGPVEATVIGNALVQLIALGELSNLSEGRQLVAKMDTQSYTPQPPPETTL